MKNKLLIGLCIVSISGFGIMIKTNIDYANKQEKIIEDMQNDLNKTKKLLDVKTNELKENNKELEKERNITIDNGNKKDDDKIGIHITPDDYDPGNEYNGMCTVNEDLPVPNIIGNKIGIAERELKSKSLYIGNVKYEFSDKEKDTIISQEPNSGNTYPNMKINVVLSKGKEIKEANKEPEIPLEP